MEHCRYEETEAGRPVGRSGTAEAGAGPALGSEEEEMEKCTGVRES